MVWVVSLTDMELIPHALTPGYCVRAFGVCLGSVTLRPLAQTVLYLPHGPPEAAPKGISGRTSYLRVCLAFHPYPQVIHGLFNALRFGPPPRYYRGFALPMGSSPGFGSTPAHIDALIRTRFPYGSGAEPLNLASESNSPAHYSIGTRSPTPVRIALWCRAPTACRHTVSGSISLPAQGFFSPFPHGTGSLSVASEYLALEGGPPGFGRDSPCPALLGNTTEGVSTDFAYGAVTLYGASFHTLRLSGRFVTPRSSRRLEPVASHNPAVATAGAFYATVGLGCSPFARRY